MCVRSPEVTAITMDGFFFVVVSAFNYMERRIHCKNMCSQTSKRKSKVHFVSSLKIYIKRYHEIGQSRRKKTAALEEHQ